MPGYQSIAATGRSLARYLTACFAADQPVEGEVTTAVIVGTGEFDVANAEDMSTPALALFLYGVEVNKTMRAAWSAAAYLDGIPHLPLDLHYLITAWADNAEHEQLILGKAMTCIETTPILTGPLLSPAVDWETGEALQVTPEDLVLEDQVRLFNSIDVGFRLSVGYLVRVLRADGLAVPQDTLVAKLAVGAVPSGKADP
jgi:hypothetical protein